METQWWSEEPSHIVDVPSETVTKSDQVLTVDDAHRVPEPPSWVTSVPLAEFHDAVDPVDSVPQPDPQSRGERVG